jgi:UDP-GlcNAc3NAcA epimerase
VAHVEAGLRSFNMNMPEEINRILTDRISDVLCCPTENAVKNLRREAFDQFDCCVVNTGDVMHDAALYYSAASTKRSTIIDRLSLSGEGFVLCTIHRAENTDDPERLKSIVRALNQISREIRIVLPLHPRTEKVLRQSGLTLEFPTVAPVGYFDMLELLKRCRVVTTDSGGLQKEAFFFSKPCVTLRDETEWVELSDCGANLVVGAETQPIVDGVHKMIARHIDFNQRLYGDGHAAERIVQAITA